MINPDSYEFMLFVNWLVDEKDFTAKEILDVVYYSHKYEKQMKEYLACGLV